VTAAGLLYQKHLSDYAAGCGFLLSLSDAAKIDEREKDFSAQADNLRSKLLVYEKTEHRQQGQRCK